MRDMTIKNTSQKNNLKPKPFEHLVKELEAKSPRFAQSYTEEVARLLLANQTLYIS
jgi:hypothetical protein